MKSHLNDNHKYTLKIYFILDIYQTLFDTGHLPVLLNTGHLPVLFDTRHLPVLSNTGHLPVLFDTGHLPVLFDTGQLPDTCLILDTYQIPV